MCGGYLSVWGDVRVCERTRVCVWGGGGRACLEHISVWVLSSAGCCKLACEERCGVRMLTSVGFCRSETVSGCSPVWVVVSFAVSLLAVQGPSPVWVIVSFADEERSSKRFHTSVCCLFVCGVVRVLAVLGSLSVKART